MTPEKRQDPVCSPAWPDSSCAARAANGTAGTARRSTFVSLSCLFLLLAVACGGETGSDGDASAGGTQASAGNASGASQSSSGAGGQPTATGGSAGRAGSTSSAGTATAGSAGSGTAGQSAAGGSSAGQAAAGDSGAGSTAGGEAGEAGAAPSAAGDGGAAGAGAAGAGGGAPTACEAQDVSASGPCDAAFGVFFLGTSCGFISGCDCEGADCSNPYPDEQTCERANRGCLSGCSPQDVTLVGDCDPINQYAFNGVECVPMVGCECVGEDCDEIYNEPGECDQAHAACEDIERDCDEIAAVYDDYASHTACTEDSDCIVVYGDCAIGIGGCHYTVNRHWGQEGLISLAEAWSAQGCVAGVCDCIAPPAAAVCEDGVCVGQE